MAENVEPRTTPVPEIAYTIPHASLTEAEVTRLDEMHMGYKDYLDGKLSFAPLEESNPTAILELGTGSGAWAIQAARQFPDATVVAVDASPLPPRHIPPNMTFRILNLLEPFPFEPKTFDVIHARLVFMHIPNADSVISRVIELVKPGGWLLLEDLDFKLRDESELGLGPATKEWVELYNSTMRSKGVKDGTPAHDKVLLASGVFSEVNVKTILFPVSEKSGDPKSDRLGASYRASLKRLAINMAKQGVPGYTLELAKAYGAEVDDPRRNVTSTVVFCWGKRRL